MYGHVGSGWYKQPSLKCTEKRYLIPWQSRGRGFESLLLHKSVKHPFLGAFFFADEMQYSHFYLVFGYFDDVDSKGQRVHF
jgi:hypothetical protein